MLEVPTLDGYQLVQASEVANGTIQQYNDMRQNMYFIIIYIYCLF